MSEAIEYKDGIASTLNGIGTVYMLQGNYAWALESFHKSQGIIEVLIGAGEGVIGLTWALFVAGVPSTVVSQWKVESASARDLMLSFHRQLRAPASAEANMTRAEALRRAALKVMKNPETSHPFYWAGFVLVGAS